MKTLLITAGAIALLAAGSARAENDKIDLMPAGVVCDKAHQVCYDQRGANVAQTRRMFGEYAGQEVQKRLDKKGDWGTKKFTLSNGVKCSIPNRKCEKDEGERSKKITKHLFEAPMPQPR